MQTFHAPVILRPVTWFEATNQCQITVAISHPPMGLYCKNMK